jgi:hypothetical protein
MSTPVDELPYQPESPARSRLFVVVMISVGLGFGTAGSVGFLLWWDQNRWEKWEQERLDSLAGSDLRAKAAKAREDANRPLDPSAVPQDALGHLNDQFRNLYRITRGETLVRTSPVIVVEGDDLILLRDGERRRAAVVPPLYHELKAYAHIPLAAYLMTGLDRGKEIPAERQQEITRCREWIKDARADLQKKGYSVELRQRQEKLLDETDDFLASSHRRAAEKKEIDPKERVAFAQKMKAPILANVHDAAKVQIDALDAQMAKWRKELNDDQWKNLKVVVIGSAMPRKNHIAVQYFAYLLNEPGEDKRIVYAESLFEEQKALNLLGTHVLDAELGRAFFSEPTRMKRDLLGDDAEQILAEMRRANASLKPTLP